MSKYRNAVFHDFKSRCLVIFSSNYGHRTVLKIPFSDHIFPKISKYHTKNLHFPSTDKYDTPSPVPRFALLTLKKGFVRPHLDCTDIIHDKADNATFHAKLELIQYNNACLHYRVNAAKHNIVSVPISDIWVGFLGA